MGRSWVLVLLLVAMMLTGCSNSDEVNAAFSRTRVSWFVFDSGRSDGLRPLAGFDEALAVTWVPRTRAVFATDLVPTADGAAAAVSMLGLLVLEDSAGTLKALRPQSQLPLSSYQTDRVFTWEGKVLLTLRQEPPIMLPPATLAWWAPDQSRLAFYPIPSQIQNPDRQAVACTVPSQGSSSVNLTWKFPRGNGWAFDSSTFFLNDGTESSEVLEADLPMAEADPSFAPLRARLAERLGAEVPSSSAQASEPLLLFTEAGWVAVGTKSGAARLYRLPELGTAGRYTKAVALKRGYVFAWETLYRGYTGAAGLVHVPFAVLAP